MKKCVCVISVLLADLLLCGAGCSDSQLGYETAGTEVSPDISVNTADPSLRENTPDSLPQGLDFGSYMPALIRS